MFVRRRGNHHSGTWAAGLLLMLLALGAVQQPASAVTPAPVDVGRFGLNTLAGILPSIIYRPIDELGVRPGAEALGMGGAYMARASGPMAIGWNPAGLASLTSTQLSADGFVLSSSSTVGDFPDTLSAFGQTFLSSSYQADLKSSTRANLLAAGTPLWQRDGLRLVGAVSWRRFYEMTFPAEYIEKLVVSRTEISYPITTSGDRDEKGTVQAFAPTLALQVGPNLAVGANLNFLTGRLHSHYSLTFTSGGPAAGSLERLGFQYSGFVPDLGVRALALNSRLMVAGKVTPGYTLKVRGGGFSQSEIGNTTGQVTPLTGKVADYDLKIPFSFAAGIALRPIDRLYLAFDVTGHNWSKTKLNYVETPEDTISTLHPNLPLRDVSTVHLGAEFALLRRPWGEIPVRVGYHTAPLSISEILRSDYAADTTISPTGAPAVQMYNAGSYNGAQIKGHAVSFGASLRLKQVTYDIGFEIASYDIGDFFFNLPYNQIFNPHSMVVPSTRKVHRLSLSSTYTF
jgi:hypothetical protein